MENGFQISQDTAGYRRELDALRFFAFLCVFWFHRMVYVPADSTYHPWLFRLDVVGVFGVPVFFLLSSYLITDGLLRERQQSDRIRIGAFYTRRLLRIWPLYFTAFFGLALLNRFLPGVGAADPHAWLAFSCFAGNWYIVRHGWIAGPVDPLWSISVEEQFYLVIPLLAAFGGRKAIVIASSLFLALAYATVLLYPSHPGWGNRSEWPNSLVQFQFFSAGALIAILLRGRSLRLSMPYRVAGLIAGFECWLLAMVRFHIGVLNPHPTAPGALAGWSLVLAGTITFFLTFQGTASRCIPSWLAYLGRISYGLYVVHALVLLLVFEKLLSPATRVAPLMRLSLSVRNLLLTSLALGLSIGLAHLSYRYFERPFLRLKEAWQVQQQ